jgi:hypothetical protein
MLAFCYDKFWLTGRDASRIAQVHNIMNQFVRDHHPEWNHRKATGQIERTIAGALAMCDANLNFMRGLQQFTWKLQLIHWFTQGRLEDGSTLPQR